MMATQFDDVSGGDEPAQPAKNPLKFATSAAGYPTVFADGIAYMTKTGGVVRLTVVESILEAADALSPGPKTRHVGTLVMPVEGFLASVEYFNAQIRQWDLMDGE